MSGWLDSSNNANCFKQTYVQGFVDVSGGSIITRGTGGGLVIGGDSSLNGTVYLGDSIFVRSDGLVAPGTADNGATAIYVDVSGNAENGAISYDISGNAENGATVSSVSIPSDASWNNILLQSGTNGYITNAVSNSDCTTFIISRTNGTTNASNTKVYRLTNGTWDSMTPSSSQSVIALSGNGNVYAIGLSTYKYNGSVWVSNGDLTTYGTLQTTSFNYDGTVAIVCGSNSLYGSRRFFTHNGSSWTLINEDYLYNRTYVLCLLLNTDTSGQIWSLFSRGSGTAQLTGAVDGYTSTNNGVNWTALSISFSDGARVDSASMNAAATLLAIGFNTSAVHDNTVHIYTRIAGASVDSWSFAYNINNIATGVNITGNHYFGRSGLSMSSDGNSLAVSAGNASPGYAFIYNFNGSSWSLGQTLTENTRFGNNVNLSSDGTRVSLYSTYSASGAVGSGTGFIYEITNTKTYSDVFGGYYDVSVFGGYLNDGLTSAALYVNGDTDLSGGLTVSGDVSFNAGNLFVAGDLSLNGNLFINSYAANSIGADAIDSTVDINFANKLSVSTSDISFSTTGLQVATDFNSDNTPVNLATNLTVPANIAIVDGSNDTVYGSYLTLTNKDATAYYNVGKSASGIFNIVDQASAGVYLASGGTSFTGTSDARLKTNIAPLKSATDKIMALNPCTYQWKSEVESAAADNTTEQTKPHVGFIAQEVEKIMPELVHSIDHPAGPDYKGVNTTDMIPYLVRTIQENTRKLAQLRAGIDEYKNR